MNSRPADPFIVLLAIIAVVVFTLFVYDTVTTINLQSDHTTICHALAETPGITYANTGCT